MIKKNKTKQKTYTKEESRVETALFLFFHFHVSGHRFGEGDTMLLYKGHRSPLFELPNLLATQKNVSHPFVSTKISFYCSQYAPHILRGCSNRKTKEALETEAGPPHFRLILYHGATRPPWRHWHIVSPCLGPWNLCKSIAKYTGINTPLQNMSY